MPLVVNETIARVVHEALRAFRAANGEPPLPAWSQAPKWMIKSTIEGVRFGVENRDAPASAQHNQWMQEKVAAGWTYGPVRDDAAKLHPMMVSYAQLPDSEKRTDHLFAAVVRSLTDRL